MRYTLDENRGDIHYEVDGDMLILKIKPEFVENLPPYEGGGGSGPSDIYIITVDDETPPTDENVFSALRTLEEIYNSKVEMEEMFLRKDIDDTAHGNITFDKNISSTIFLDGWDGKGWQIQNTGLAEFDGMRIRSDVFLNGKIGSPSFASGFTGWGWEIDTPTASGTVDNWTVRKSLKVYELVYSQIYGLSGSVMITDFNKIKSVTPLGTGRYHCEMDDMEGEMFMNLRNGDIVRVQKRDGWNIRYYYALVENVTSDTFDLKIIDGVDIPQEGDVCFRMGSKTDKNRQGLVYLTSSDDYSAYIDILDGIDGPSFEGKTKVRLGNLRGLTVNGQPLDMHGIYINGGIFQHSSYYLDNGNTIEQQFSIMNGKFESEISGIRNDMSIEAGNILRNSSFSQNTNYWITTVDVHFLSVEGSFVYSNYFFAEKAKITDIYQDGSRNVLRIRNGVILQKNEVMNKEAASVGEGEEEELKTYSFSLYVKPITSGTLSVGIEGTELYLSQTLEPSETYEKIAVEAKWNEKGDFKIAYDGEILVYGVSLFDDALADAYIKLMTRIEQTEEYIKLLATKEYVDSENESVITRFESELQVTAEQISGISTKVDNVENTIETSGWITRAEGTTIFAKKEMEGGEAIVNAINVGTGGIKISANRVDLVGQVTFSMFSSSVQNTINGKVDGSDLGDLAYQDIVTESDLSQAIINTINSKVNSSSLGDLAYEDVIELAQLGTTIISGGYIKTNLINADAIIATNIDASQGRIGGFTIGRTHLTNNNGAAGITIMYNSYKFVHINGLSSTAMISARWDSHTAISASAYSGGIGIELLANDNSRTIKSTGPADFELRNNEYLRILLDAYSGYGYLQLSGVAGYDIAPTLASGTVRWYEQNGIKFLVLK